MNVMRLLSVRASRSMHKSPTQRITKLHHRTFQRTSSPFFRQRKQILHKSSSLSSFSTRKSSGVFGASVMSTFIKTSVVFYAIPLSALASPYFMTLPLDVVYGCVLPYHAYVGMAHIFTGMSITYRIFANIKHLRYRLCTEIFAYRICHWNCYVSRIAKFEFSG